MSSSSSKKRKFIIDTDAGLDDAQAILVALSASDVDVVALTTVSGNASAKQVGTNLLRLLRVAGRLDIPVYRGCENMLLGWEKPPDYNYHGKDGFGDILDASSEHQSEELIQSKHAVQALLDITKDNPGEISIIAIGPLTNIAMAIRMDGDFGKRLRSCYIMGGNYRGEGNITPTGEFNFYSDPEAAFIVLNNLECPVTMICWELCVQHSLTWDTYENLRKHSTKKCQFLKQLEGLMISNCRRLGWPKYIPCDELAVACAVDETVIRNSQDVYASVELHGQLTRGQMVIDWENSFGKKSNIRIVTDINQERYMDYLNKAVL